MFDSKPDRSLKTVDCLVSLKSLLLANTADPLAMGFTTSVATRSRIVSHDVDACWVVIRMPATEDSDDQSPLYDTLQLRFR